MTSGQGAWEDPEQLRPPFCMSTVKEEYAYLNSQVKIAEQGESESSQDKKMQGVCDERSIRALRTRDLHHQLDFGQSFLDIPYVPSRIEMTK